jgi:serine phosphatase RsbU (regulator of sigma subunit)
MKFNFQTRITLWVAGILVAAIGAAAAFFISIYSNEKLASTFEEDLSTTYQEASHFESLLLSPTLLDPNQIKVSKEIIAEFSRPCSPALTQKVVSAGFQKLIDQTKFDLNDILSSPELVSNCAVFLKGELKQAAFFSGGPAFLTPYILVLLPGSEDRLLMISADGFALNSTPGLSMIVDFNGAILWKGASTQDTMSFLDRVDVRTNDLTLLAKRALSNNLPGLSQVNKDGYVVYAPIFQKFVLLNVGSQHQILESVRLIQVQLGWLILGFFCLVMIIAKRIAQGVGKPLRQLVQAADSLAEGKFTTRLPVGQDPEFQTVQKTFNHLAGELTRLMDVAKESSKMESELALAQKVQQVLFPPAQIKMNGYDIQSSVKNAEQCGGDWWGYVTIPQENKAPKVLLLIGDVTGHGAPSALVTASIQGGLTMLTFWIEQDPTIVSDLRKVLSLFNECVFKSSGGALSMSFQICLLDPEANTLTLANAGHNWPYLIVNGVLKSIGAASPVLGNNHMEVFEHVETHPWNPGDKLFLYTDGLIDCYKDDKNLFDRRIFLRILKTLAPEKASVILKELMKERENKILGLKPADDVTVVVCSREMSPS